MRLTTWPQCYILGISLALVQPEQCVHIITAVGKRNIGTKLIRHWRESMPGFDDYELLKEVKEMSLSVVLTKLSG